jgi:hypothetical protein
LSTASLTPSSLRTLLRTLPDEWPALSPPLALCPPTHVTQWQHSKAVHSLSLPHPQHLMRLCPTWRLMPLACAVPHAAMQALHLPPNWFDATAWLEGKVHGVPVVSYCKHGVCSTARPRARTPAPSREPSASPLNEAPPMPDVEEEEQAAPEAPRELPVDNDNNDNLFAQPQARLELKVIDVSNAYLNGQLHDVGVYMRQPNGFAERDSTWVARLIPPWRPD